ncbi:DUF2812 domain-containing protein [Romboutsia sp.]|uniref:DUF2812 domain-containing protein n=1 Tax=Romboutsia sp. TaxID=1965302 RepID=UPI003F35D90C
MKELKKVFKVFICGQEEKECNWLLEMSKKGYHVVKLSYPTCYVFEIGEPRNYKYIIDIKANSNISESEYLNSYKEKPCEYITNFKKCYYFRCDENIDTNQIVTMEVLKEKSLAYCSQIILAIVGSINMAIFSITLILSIFNLEKIHVTSFSNLTIGIMCLAVYVANKNKQQYAE